MLLLIAKDKRKIVKSHYLFVCSRLPDINEIEAVVEKLMQLIGIGEKVCGCEFDIDVLENVSMEDAEKAVEHLSIPYIEV